MTDRNSLSEALIQDGTSIESISPSVIELLALLADKYHQAHPGADTLPPAEFLTYLRAAENLSHGAAWMPRDMLQDRAKRVAQDLGISASRLLDTLSWWQSLRGGFTHD